MVREIVTDIMFLKKRSLPATKNDGQTVCNLKDTLRENRDRCVGMAANMIGEAKRIIIFTDGGRDTVMLNPIIISRSGRYETEEGCLSLIGIRRAVRYKQIEVRYLDEEMKQHQGKFSGFAAQVIQHECDHLNGVII